VKTIRELMDLGGRVALITGGAGHIGAAMGEALAELGAKIVILDVEEGACRQTSEEISSRFRVESMALSVDLSEEKEIRQTPAAVIGRHGRLDILVNCAALVNTSTMGGWTVPFPQQSSEAWALALRINLTAPFLLTQVFADVLSASGHGSVINIGSIYGMVGPKWDLYEGTSMGNPAAYGASKGGLLQLTKYLATTMAPSVRVNMITPGGIFREQPQAFVHRYEAGVPLGRMASEEDLKGAVAYLASDLSAYMTGQNLVVDGGWTVW
jgi:NAD(P)-dependent dehydrogenase (short-subunit alcohol dehydrogenase family)